MDLDNATAIHAEWKLTLRTAILKKEPMDAVTVSLDSDCELGKWLHGEAHATYSHLESYPACVAKHATFHSVAGKVAAEINKGNYSEAEAMLAAGTDYANASSDVRLAILHLKQEAGL